MKTSETPDFKEFFNSYLEAALWRSTIDEGEQNDGRNGDPFDAHFNIADFDEDALELLHTHALSFWSRVACYVPHEKGRANGGRPGPAQAGHDFWLTQNGHGAGFWDGDWPTYGETFTKISKCYPELHLSITETGKVGAE